jgi:hypothetical protein
MNLGRSASNAHRYTIESARWPSAAPVIVMVSSSRPSDDAASVDASRVNPFRQERAKVRWPALRIPLKLRWLPFASSSSLLKMEQRGHVMKKMQAGSLAGTDEEA